MSDRNLDPRAVAERLRGGEHVSLSQLRGSCATRRVRTHQLLSVIARNRGPAIAARNRRPVRLGGGNSAAVVSLRATPIS
jgi:hypothetical protein